MLPRSRKKSSRWSIQGLHSHRFHRERLERVGAQVLRRMGFRGPDTVVIAERNDVEVIGAHTIEGPGLAADLVQKNWSLRLD